MFEQIADFFLEMIGKGVYTPGSPLPSVREVALQEAVNPNTVLKAYGLLEEKGIVIAVPKKGYFVAEKPSVEDEVSQALLYLLGKGYSKQEIMDKLMEIKEGEK
ncbi:MAG: GntR family transcriptional regulator [Bacilli bacterium]|nr:GntR family transcriptional regulator [Bacilli bacterium]